VGYRRLTLGQRYQIAILKSKGAINSEIARELGVHRSSITRELRLCKTKYCAESAQRISLKNLKKRSEANRKIKGSLKRQIDQLILSDWSPEQAEQTIFEETYKQISLRTIYRYIERDALEGGKLKKHLRILRKQRKDRKKPKYRSDQGLVRNRVPIEQRPKIVEKRIRVGDYERDTMLGSRGGNVLLAIVDRKTRYLKIAMLPKLNAENAHQATVKLLKNKVIKTITNDNGIEFAFHQRTSKKLNVPIYFSRSYRAWERGTNENTIGLLRQYFPKKQPIPTLTKKQLEAIQDKLNKRPRKCLGFKTPYELYTGKHPGRVLR